MYYLFKNHGWKSITAFETIPFCLSMLIAEAFYKFGSFVLECCAFMATWYLAGWLMGRVIPFKRKTVR